VLAQAPFEKLEPPVFFSFKTSDPGATRGASRAITAEFIRPKRLKALLADSPKSIVLLANHDISEGTAVAFATESEKRRKSTSKGGRSWSSGSASIPTF
jgi:hypothetical protein